MYSNNNGISYPKVEIKNIGKRKMALFSFFCFLFSPSVRYLLKQIRVIICLNEYSSPVIQYYFNKIKIWNNQLIIANKTVFNCSNQLCVQYEKWLEVGESSTQEEDLDGVKTDIRILEFRNSVLPLATGCSLVSSSCGVSQLAPMH